MPLDTIELTARVRDIMADTFALDPDDLADDVSQSTCARWNSLHHMTLMVALEENFRLILSMEEMISMTSLPSIVTRLQARVAVGA